MASPVHRLEETIMKTRFSLVVAVSLTFLACVFPPIEAAAQNGESSPYSVGLQSAWPAYGISGKMDMSDTFTAEAILGGLGALTTVSGRGYWYLERKPKHAWYGFGTVGAWRWSDRYYLGNDLYDDSETAIAFGGGAGVELDWRAIFDPDFPSLRSTIDVGLTMSTFNRYANWSLIGFGFGLHYHF